MSKVPSRLRSRRRLFSHARRNNCSVPRPCPSWCQVDHETDVDLDGERLHAGNPLQRVSLWATDNLESGDRSETIVVDRANNLTGEQARALVLEILEGGAR